MNLKLVVATMSILGLVSCPAFAATHSKHKHKVKHQAVAATQDYKDMGSFKDAGALCTISQAALVMDGMTQNVGRSMPNPCNPGWFNRLQFSGGVNVDLGKFGNTNANYMGENYRRFSLNDAYLNVGASINDWAHAFASLSYNTATVNAPTQYVPTAEYSAAYSNNANGTLGNSTVQLEQGFAVFGNPDASPFFLQVGKSFQDFSRYEIHPITASLTQVMSETLATSGKIGFIVPMGFHGAIYAFDDPINKVGKSTTATNYGASLGYDVINDQMGWDVGVGYLYNMIGANDVAYSVNQYNVNANNGSGYNTRAGAVALYGDVNSGPFTLGARYTVAVQRFNPLDMPKNGVADTTATTLAGVVTAVNVNAGASGAKPWAAGVQAGYGFEGWGKNQNVYLGYQASREAAGLLIPKSRWLVGYGVEMFGKNTNIGVEWDHDMAYNASNGGTGNNTNLVSVRTSVKFG
jgi:hypothetical protein